jgi:Fic family protein
MNYVTTKQVSDAWNISERRVRNLCAEGRVEGAVKFGTTWNIPETASKPIDNRKKLENKFIINVPQSKFDELYEKKKILDSKRPLSEATLKSLRENYILEWTYNSNAIEGNTLTLRETKVALEGITVSGKSVKEHLEAINHKDAIVFLEDLAKQNTLLTEIDIRDLHRLVLKGIDNENYGKYRTENVIISGATHIPPDNVFVKEEMAKLILKYRDWTKKYNSIIVAGLLHGEFVKIHPFIDGNGRTARLLLNLVTIKNGFTPIIIKNDMRAEYYDSLDKAHTTLDYTDFINLIIKSANMSLDLYLKVIGK